jgi:hypothetical protein
MKWGSPRKEGRNGINSRTVENKADLLAVYYNIVVQGIKIVSKNKPFSNPSFCFVLFSMAVCPVHCKIFSHTNTSNKKLSKHCYMTVRW